MHGAHEETAPAVTEQLMMDLNRGLSEAEREVVEQFLAVTNPSGPIGDSISCLHGFFTSIVSGPIVMPSEWMRMVFGDSEDHAWDSIEQAQTMFALVMRFHNEVASDLLGGAYAVLFDRLGDEPDIWDIAVDWCKGYLHGVSIRANEWQRARDDELAGLLEPIREGAREYRETDREEIDRLADCAIGIHAWWRDRLSSIGQPARRAAPKINVNAACPCGSGKKYKKCCLR